MLDTPSIRVLCRTSQYTALLSTSFLHPLFTCVSLLHPFTIEALLIFFKTSYLDRLISSSQFLVVFIFCQESLHQLALPYFFLMIGMFYFLVRPRWSRFNLIY